MRERTSATALWSDGERCHGVHHRRRPDRRRGDRAGDRRRRGAVAAHHQPARARSAPARCWRRPPAPTSPTSSSASSTRPRSPCPGTRFDGVLITEAVRGEGAKLLDAAGERFTDELAPRDAVTAAILDRHARPTAPPTVKLDLREIDPARFPNVFASLAEAGLDPRAEPVPVAPAAHYTMGGVAVDLDGRSSLPGLYAVGECSCTGLHGANRLASNSLSECFVFGGRAAARGASRRPAAASARRCPSGASSRRPRRPATRSGASPARCATPTTSPRWSATPTRWRRRSPRCALERARVARRPPAHRLPRDSTPASTASTSSSRPDGERPPRGAGAE